MAKHRIIRPFNNRAAQFILDHRLLWMCLVLVVVAASAAGLKRLRFDSSNESFLPNADELRVANELLKDTFGNEEFVFILVESEDLFSSEVLSGIRKLSDDLERSLPFVRDVSAITNIDYMDGVDGGLEISQLISDPIPETASSIKEIQRKLSSSKLYMGKMVTEDWRYTGISITFDHMPDNVWVDHPTVFSPVDELDWPDEEVIMMDQIYYDREESPNPDSLVEVVDARKLIAPALKVILRRHRAAGLTIVATGVPVMDFEGDRLIEEEGARLGSIALAAATVLLLVLFRSASAIAGPLLVILFTVVTLFGVMGWLNIPLSMMSIIVAPLLMVISVSYSIHFINHFNYRFRAGVSRGESLIYAYEQAAWPCFLTALTTCIGFMSFLIVPMAPIRDMGIASGLGVLIAYGLVMIIVPIVYSIGRASYAGGSEKRRRPQESQGGLMDPLSRWIGRHLIGVGLVALVGCSVTVSQIPRIKVETDFFSLIGQGISYIDEALAITDILGGQYSYELLVELPEAEMGKDPAVLNAVDQIAGYATEYPNANSSMSLADLVKEINFVMHNRSERFYAIPDSQQLIAQYLLLYEMSGGDTLNDWVDINYQKLRLSVQLKNSDNLEAQVNQVIALAKRLLPPETTVSALGDIPVMIRLMNLLTDGQIKSILVAFIAIGLIMIVITRSVRAGLISLVPNIFPVLVIMGVMGVIGINLDMITVMIAPMIIGIAVDDTVHFFIHFKEEFNETRSYHQANVNTFRKIGYALLYTSIVLTFGFIVFGFSHMRAIVNMGVLAAVGIVSALLADFFIAPVLLILLKPFGKERGKKFVIQTGTDKSVG